ASQRRVPIVLRIHDRRSPHGSEAAPRAGLRDRRILAGAPSARPQRRVRRRQRSTDERALASLPPGPDEGHARPARSGRSMRAGGKGRMNRLAVDDVRGAAGLAALRVEWEELFESVPRASPFLSPEWALTWQELLAERSTPRVLCTRRDGRLVGVLALSEREHWAGLGRPVKRLAFLAEQDVGADGLDVLALPGFERDAASAILARLASDSSVDVLDLDGLAGESPTLQLLVWLFGTDRHRYKALAPDRFSRSV